MSRTVRYFDATATLTDDGAIECTTPDLQLLVARAAAEWKTPERTFGWLTYRSRQPVMDDLGEDAAEEPFLDIPEPTVQERRQWRRQADADLARAPWVRLVPA